MLHRLRAWWDRRRRRGILALFRGGPDDSSGAGVRESRRPKQPSLTGAVALDEPDDDT
jgi:hypothetical protein